MPEWLRLRSKYSRCDIPRCPPIPHELDLTRYLNGFIDQPNLPPRHAQWTQTLKTAAGLLPHFLSIKAPSRSEEDKLGPGHQSESWKTGAVEDCQWQLCKAFARLITSGYKLLHILFSDYYGYRYSDTGGIMLKGDLYWVALTASYLGDTNGLTEVLHEFSRQRCVSASNQGWLQEFDGCLSLAARSGQFEAVRFWLQAGANVVGTLVNGQQPLSMAVAAVSPAVLELLFENEASKDFDSCVAACKSACELNNEHGVFGAQAFTRMIQQWPELCKDQYSGPNLSLASASGNKVMVDVVMQSALNDNQERFYIYCGDGLRKSAVCIALERGDIALFQYFLSYQPRPLRPGLKQALKTAMCCGHIEEAKEIINVCKDTDLAPWAFIHASKHGQMGALRALGTLVDVQTALTEFSGRELWQDLGLGKVPAHYSVGAAALSLALGHLEPVTTSYLIRELDVRISHSVVVDIMQVHACQDTFNSLSEMLTAYDLPPLKPETIRRAGPCFRGRPSRALNQNSTDSNT